MSNHNWLLFQRKLFRLLPIIFLKSSDLVHVVEMYWTISKQSLILLQLFRRELGLHALITIFNIVEFHLVSLSYEYSLTCVWVSSFCNKNGSKRAANTCIHVLFWRLEVWNRFYGPQIKVSARLVPIGDSRTHPSSFQFLELQKLACCNSWGHKESDTTEWLNWTELRSFWHSQNAITAVLGPHQSSLCFLLLLTSCFTLWFCQVHSGPSRKMSPSQDPSLQFSSVTQCLTLCNSMNRSTSGLPVHHQLLEFTQTHVHWVGDAI